MIRKFKICGVALSFVYFAFFPSLLCAKQPGFTKEVVTLSNEMISKIYEDIVYESYQHPELKNFGAPNLTANASGISIIKYQYKSPDKTSRYRDLEFGVTVEPLNAPGSFADKKGGFSYLFPLLGVKMSGYQIVYMPSKQFDLQQSVIRNGHILWDYQQVFLPFKLTLESTKDFFRVGEDTEFTVTLTNVSNNNLKVKDLDSDTLYFLFNNEPWGAKSLEVADPTKTRILKKGESIKRTFQGDSFVQPQTVEIYGSYVMTYKGVKPSDILTIQILK